VVKEEPDFVISPGLVDLHKADAIASTSATRRSKKLRCTGFKKYVTKGLTVYGVVRIIQHNVSVIRELC
jgi:hypothetical protein